MNYSQCIGRFYLYSSSSSRNGQIIFAQQIVKRQFFCHSLSKLFTEHLFTRCWRSLPAACRFPGPLPRRQQEQEGT